MKNFLSTLCLCLLAAASARSQTLTNTHFSCNSFRTTFSGSIPNNLFETGPNAPCTEPGGFDPFRFEAGASIKGARYQLQKQIDNGTFVNTNIVYETNFALVGFNDLEPGTYRVLMTLRTGLMPAYPKGDPCGLPKGRCVITTTDYLSPVIEIGVPIPVSLLYPNPTGITFPPKICYSLIDAASEPLLLDGTNSFGETSYFVAVFKDDLATGQNAGYASTPGFIAGNIGVFDLKSLPMYYDPGYKYTVQLVLAQAPCAGWVDQYSVFVVDGHCRQTGIENVKVYPNPTSDVVQFDGLEAWGAREIDVDVTDILGKSLLHTTMEAPFFSLSMAELPAGTYQVTLRQEQNTITKKVVRQ